MMDRFTKIILVGILLCLIIIAGNSSSTSTQYISSPSSSPNINVTTRDIIVQISPDRIGVVDQGNNSGYRQLLIFDYDNQAKTFKYQGTLTYEEYLYHPEKYGIPTRATKP